MHILKVATKERCACVDITGSIARLIAPAMRSGLCLVYCPHTTAALTINENADSDVQRDILKRLSALVPFEDGYAHTEGNSDAHIKSVLLGQSLALIVEESKLVLGQWQGVFLCEFDGPRQRRVYVQFVSNG